MRSAHSVVALLSFVGALASAPCRAQCLEWDERFSSSGTNGPIQAVTVFDDGTGPALYVAGSFTVAGKTGANNVAKWNGSRWSALTRGTDDVVYALCVFDDGTGPALYAGGNFILAGNVTANCVAKWDGASWTALGSGLTGVNGCCGAVTSVRSLCAYDDGNGAALYVGGHFTMADGAPAKSIAKWDGASWSEVGGGMPPSSPNAVYVFSMTVFDAGAGPELFLGGNFHFGPGGSLSLMARWNGTNWSPLAGGDLDSYAYALTVFDDGTGPALYAGGFFFHAGGVTTNKVAKWNGTNWSALGSGMQANGSASVQSLAVFDDGNGDALYAGGTFTWAGGTVTNNVAKWNGSAWSALGSGVNSTVLALGVFATESGPSLYGAGQFTQAVGSIASAQVASWNGTSWSALSPGGMGLSDTVNALTTYDDGAGPALYAGGGFTIGGTTSANGVAKWNGSSWSALGNGTSGPVSSLAVYDDGTGPGLFVGGDFWNAGGVAVRSIAKWNGSSWSALGAGLYDWSPNAAYALAVFDDGTGPQLYAGGSFATAGTVDAEYIARWNGTTWSSVGGGFGLHNAAHCYALTVFDDGSGAALYAGGAFNQAGGITAQRVAKWNGSTWSAVGAGMPAISARVYALAVFDDGSGPALYAGGTFTTAGGVTATNIARWSRSLWWDVGGGTNNTVRALTVFDDGSGPALYAGGDFTVAGGTGALRMAKWNGASWSPVGAGMDAPVRALAAFDDGADGAPDLYAGGSFTMIDDKPSLALAEWHGCPPGAAYCFGDGIDSVVTAGCPCGNVGEPGHGCANSNAALGGARLIGSGTINPNTIVLTCTGVNNNTLCTFFRGPNHDPQAAVFGDGIKCINPPIFRFGQQNSGQGGNPAFTVAVPAPAELPGSLFHYAVHYRNPVGGFCLPALFNASNGYSIQW